MSKPKAQREREILVEAQSHGGGATLKAFVRLSGPGWLQSAITLGGGSLSGALFLGVLGGFSMLWLQLVAITFGVIMLSAISYVTLSTGQRPFRAINQHINPALGWGWIIATVLANIIWCMPQFSLSYAAIQKNLSGGALPDTNLSKIIISAVLLIAALGIVLLNNRRGVTAKIFDIILKVMVGLVVICFFGVVAYLIFNGKVQFSRVLTGFIPDLSQWSQPNKELADLIRGLPVEVGQFWEKRIVSHQRNVMIGAAATAVGINMTFLLPYSMLARGWDRPFRGLARFDLLTALAIPYILVTSCVVIASASSFYAKADEDFLSSDVQAVQSSPIYNGAKGAIVARMALTDGDTWSDGAMKSMSDSEKETAIATALTTLDESERLLAAAVVKRDAFQLSKSLSPLLGENVANLVFGLGVFGMGFSTIIILMLINGYAFCEIFDKPTGGVYQFIGCLIAGIFGACWFYFWNADSKFWLTIMASVFGMMLLPIAYFTFFMMMNSRKILGDDLPKGITRLIWNILMVLAVTGAIVAAGSAIYTKATDPDPRSAPFVIGLAIVYGLAVIAGFVAVKRKDGNGKNLS